MTENSKIREHKDVEIYGKTYKVCYNEFNKINHNEFNNLNIINNLGKYERLISLIKELSLIEKDMEVLFYQITDGGFFPIKCSEFIKVNICNETDIHTLNFKNNINKNNINKDCINITTINNFKNLDKKFILIIHDNVKFLNEEMINFINNYNPIILYNSNLNLKFKNIFFTYNLSTINDTIENIINDNKLSLSIPYYIHENFLKEFHYFISGHDLNYDNLIHYTMIIKNGGDSLENVLIENLPFIDRWTILDTGSTDNTIEIINKILVGKKKGQLYQESFINFRDSRNRCIELAGQTCKYILMLDDTYIVKNNLRKFLNTVRGDLFSNSFSLFIHSHDNEYSSNRIIKSDSNLRYIYKIHEVITPENNINVIIPSIHSFIFDFRSDTMEKRTMDRKEYDLKILFEEAEESPNDPRAYYYIGQTYNLIEKYDMAYKYYLKRVDHPVEGFLQEKIDACFEAARIANFQLKLDWKECKKLYEKSYMMDKTRPESLYFIGIHYYLEAKEGKDHYNNLKIAYHYFKKGFQLGYPEHAQYSLKPTLSYYFLPKFLTELCYIFNDFVLGEQSASLFLNSQYKNGKLNYKEIFNQHDFNIINNWYNIYKYINNVPLDILTKKLEKINKIPYLCFFINENFSNYKKEDNENEINFFKNMIFHLANNIQKTGKFKVFIFCNCEFTYTNNDIEYISIKDFCTFFQHNIIDIFIICDIIDFIPFSLKCANIKNVYAILFNLTNHSYVIPYEEKFKNIFCLSTFHLEYLKKTFPSLKEIIHLFKHGINLQYYKNINTIIDIPIENTIIDMPLKFIYISDVRKGLIPLLQMWPHIISRYPHAQLRIHSKLDENINSYEMVTVKNILNKYKKDEKTKYNIFTKEYINNKHLIESWCTSDIWFYTCTYNETCYSDIMIAALSKTLVITTKIQAFESYIEDRGILLDINNNMNLPYDVNWQKFAVNELFKIIENNDLRNELINKNFNWVNDMSWEKRTNYLIENYFKVHIKPVENKIIEDKNILDIIHSSKHENKKFEKILNFGNCININSYYSLINEYNIKEIFTYCLEDNKIIKTQEILKCRIEKINDNIMLYNNIFNLIIYDNSCIDQHELYLNLHICMEIIKKHGIIIINNTRESNINIIEKFFVKYKDKLKHIFLNNSNIVFEKI
jgi:hypothetical protein